MPVTLGPQRHLDHWSLVLGPRAHIDSIVIYAGGIKWRHWGSAHATTGKRRFNISAEGEAEPEKVRAVLTLSRRVHRPGDGCGYLGGGRTYTRATIRVLSGFRKGDRLKLDLPPTGCETY
jgi:hypothetical protein